MLPCSRLDVGLKPIRRTTSSTTETDRSKRPETRYQDGDQFAADLRSVLAELPAEMRAGVTAQPGTGTGAMSAPPGASEMTAVMSTGAATGAAFEQTVVRGAAAPVSAPAPAAQDQSSEKTMVLSPAAQQGPSFDKTVVHDRTAAAAKANGTGTDIEI